MPSAWLVQMRGYQLPDGDVRALAAPMIGHNRPKRAAGQKHHYLPVFYLKQWAGVDGRLCEFSRPYKVVRPRMTHPDGTGYVRGLYEFGYLTPELTNALETRFLLRLDHKASTALAMLIQRKVDLDDATRSAWSRFLMSLIFRNPETIERLRNQIDEKYPADWERLRHEYHSIRRPGDPETFDEFKTLVKNRGIDRVSLGLLQSVMDSERVGTQLNRMVIGVYEADDVRYPLLTSDRPIVMTNGIGHPHSHLAMPISPRHVFMAANREETLEQILAQDKRGRGSLVEFLNDRMARQARKLVYGTNDGQFAFIAKRLGERVRCTPWE
jgi:hypothetical protein